MGTILLVIYSSYISPQHGFLARKFFEVVVFAHSLDHIKEKLPRWHNPIEKISLGN